MKMKISSQEIKNVSLIGYNLSSLIIGKQLQNSEIDFKIFISKQDSFLKENNSHSQFIPKIVISESKFKT